jgi:hypothetical protein
VRLLTCGSPVGDDDDQERLPQLTRPSRVQEHGLQDLLVERGSERGQAAEPDLGDDLGGLSFRGDVVALYVSGFDRFVSVYEISNDLMVRCRKDSGLT